MHTKTLVIRKLIEGGPKIVTQVFRPMIELWTRRKICTPIFSSLLQSSGGDDEPMSDNEMSRDGDSPDALSRVPATDVDPDTLEKLKQQVQ